MEYNDGSRDRDSFDPYDGDRGDSYRSDAPDRGESAYGRQEYGQSPYGQSPYAQSPYNGGSYGDYGYSDNSERSGRMTRPRSDGYGEAGRSGYDRNDRGYGYDDRASAQNERDYGRDDRAYDRDDRGSYGRGSYDDYGASGRGDEDFSATGRRTPPRGYDDYGATGRGDEDFSATGRRTAPRDYDDYGTNGRGDEDYPAAGRRTAPRGYDDYGATGRGDEDFPVTGRRTAPRGYAETEPLDESPFEAEAYNDDEAPRAPKKKKKRSKFSRFMRGLAAYIADLPTQTLVLFGGIVAVVLVGIILLVILLPKNAKPAEPADNGQLSIADITPTPSLAPTIAPPEITVEPTATPIVDPFNGSFIKTIGEENDVIPAVQERLVELGYMEMPEGGYTKRYGTATKNGIRMFQIKNYEDSADWDGCLGLGTYTLLLSDEAKAFYLARGDGDSRTQDITTLVESVKKLQARLVELGYLGAGSDTGVFGSGTATAVKTFQQYHGLLADGWAGQSTLTMLYSDAAMTAAVGKTSPYTPTPDPNAAGAITDPNAAATADPNAATAADPNTTAPTATVAEN